MKDKEMDARKDMIFGFDISYKVRVMVMQSVIFPNAVCNYNELFYRNADLKIQNEKTVELLAGTRVSFFSYMNCLDLSMWKKYTHIRYVSLKMEVQGKGRIYLKCRHDNQVEQLSYMDFYETDMFEYKKIKFEIDIIDQEGLCYFEIESISDVRIHNPRFVTTQKSENPEVHIALNICTYNRKSDLCRNVGQLKKSYFFDENSSFNNKLSIIVVDNGSELEKKIEKNYMLVHNRNTGGSGGFKRGLQELRRWKKNITHVVFMDDDVEFNNETFYRLFALLSYLKKEYMYESVAGRMFRLDKRYIQYTAVEIWNKGCIEHLGYNQDMTKEDNLLLVNANDNAEYGGWWFCCYPMSFVKNNDPLPFFIHCDDVEYGLRHKGTPIIVNGIQVWHETYEYRQSVIMQYYDTRNSMIVNAMYGFMTYEEIFEQWKRQLVEAHIYKQYEKERALILAMLFFTKGKKNFMNVDGYKVNKRIGRIKVRNKYLNCILWRYAAWRFSRMVQEDKIYEI